MSIILDIIIVAIIALTVYFAAKNGFVKTAISAVSFILAVALTAMFASPLADFLKETSVAETVESATENAITDVLLETSLGVDGLLEGKSEDFNKLVAVTGMSLDELGDWYHENIADSKKGEAVLASRIAEPITDITATAIAVLILFIGTQLALSIISRALDIVAKLPLLRTANKALGILLGAVLALLRVCLFCFVMGVLIDNAAFLDNSFLSDLDAEKTLLFKIFKDIDIFSFFI